MDINLKYRLICNKLIYGILYIKCYVGWID